MTPYTQQLAEQHAAPTVYILLGALVVFLIFFGWITCANRRGA